MKTKRLGLIMVAVISLLLYSVEGSWSDSNDQETISSPAAKAVSKAPRTQSQVKQIKGPIYKSLPSNPAQLTSITVTPPGKGYLIITATGTLTFLHTTGTQGFFCLDLSEIENNVDGCFPMQGSDSGVRSWVPADFPSTGDKPFGIPYSIVKVYEVADNSTRTFYLNGYNQDLGVTSLFQQSLMALFVPAALP